MQFLRDTGRQLLRPEILNLPPTTSDGPVVCSRCQVQTREALQACDDEQFQRIVFDLYLAKHSIADICDKVIAPTFRDIGDMWEHGALEIFQERRAVEICQRTLHRIYAMLPNAAPAAPRAFGGALEGDPYLLPTTMVELVLREAGWSASSFGTNLPVATLCDAIRKLQPRLVWLSVSASYDAEDFLTAYHQLYECAHEHGAAVAVGGRRLTPEIRSRMQFSNYSDNLNHLVGFVKTIYNPAPRPAIDPADITEAAE
jgi:methanogenic corrinoid protein MtbC1